MFVVFALHLADRREEAVRLLGIMSTALSARNGDSPEGPSAPLTLPRAVIASAESFLVDDSLMSPADAIAAHHAYTHTALMGLLNEARLRAGVLAPGQFAWLKLIDRDLWYALHSLGFETEGPALYRHPNPRVEASGARDHWAVERMVGEPVNQPSVDRATKQRAEDGRVFLQFGRKLGRASCLESSPKEAILPWSPTPEVARAIGACR
jgi:intracellular multiplication protein IcmP